METKRGGMSDASQGIWKLMELGNASPFGLAGLPEEGGIGSIGRIKSRDVMNMLKTAAARFLIVCGLSLLLPMNVHAGAANTYYDLDGAIRTGDFSVYHARISTWLVQKVPAANRISEAGLKALLKDPVFLNTLDQRQLMSKVGLDDIGKFAKADSANRVFLTWLLKNPQAMDLYLEGATPTGIAARESNRYTIPVESLDIWKKIFSADLESRQGIYLRLAIATALRPPGTGNRGAGMQEKPGEPVVRYKYFKSAHKNKELFPSFDALTVWEYQKVVSSCASESDLTWAREAINTWRPDLRIKERVVESTSQVWYRNSPWPYTNGFKSVLEGGGKCGPRSSWAVFICQAFGIPAIGVGQPGHACVAYKAADGWHVGYGRGWQVSRLEGMSGPDFVAGAEAREHTAVFSQVEHLRWLASTLASKEQAAAVMRVAGALAQSTPATQRDLAAAEKAEEAEANPGARSASTSGPLRAKQAPPSTTKPEPPFKAAPGVLHVEAASFAKMGGQASYGGQTAGVLVHDCFTGGKQVHFQPHMQSAWVDYPVNVPATGIYGLTMRVAVANREQVLDITSGTTKLATVNIPNSYGVWETTAPVDVKLSRGAQTLRVSTPFQRGVTLRWFELRSKGARL
jgi:hypothetical protein